jgi:hypothetical protein
MGPCDNETLQACEHETLQLVNMRPYLLVRTLQIGESETLQPCEGVSESLHGCGGESATVQPCERESETLSHCVRESEALHNCERANETLCDTNAFCNGTNVQPITNDCVSDDCMHVQPITNDCVSDDCMHVQPITNDCVSDDCTNVQPIARDCVSDSIVGSTNLKPEKVHLKLGLQIAEDGHINVKLNLFDKFSHKIYTGDGEVHIQNPTNERCKMVGGVRHKHVLPHFQDNGNWILQSKYFEDIFKSIQEYDGLNGHITPSLCNFTDAFCDPRGAYKKCKDYWSVVDNAFQHQWKNTNIYAFPPGEDDFIYKTLQYHSLQQSMAHQKNESFRGVYIVPYRPRAKYWKLVSNFMVLKMYKKGTLLFSPPPKTPKGPIPAPIACPYPMCVLYDPGYSEPNIVGAFCHAMEKCSEALLNETFVGFECFDALLSSEEDVSRTHCLHGDCDSANTLDANVHMSCFDGMIEELPNDPLPNVLPHLLLPFECIVAHVSECEESVMHDRGQHLHGHGMEDVVAYNHSHCLHDPDELSSQYTFTFDDYHDPEVKIKLRCMRSVGKLANILDLDDPDMGEVDVAIKEHIEALRAEEELQSDGIQVSHDIFTTEWTKGGLLPLNSCPQLRHMSSDVGGIDDTDDRCLVVRTRLFGNVCNTSLSDEGATNSVVNVDWYENQGLDWKTLFGVKDDLQQDTVYMADQHPVTTYGMVKLDVELADHKGKRFVHDFYIMRLGKHNYAQILGFDWKKKFACRTSLPEYEIEIRGLNCVVNAHPLRTRLYNSIRSMRGRVAPASDNKEACEEVAPAQLAKDVRLLSAQLRRLHLHVPPQAFLRQVVIRPAKVEDEVAHVTNLKAPLWTEDVALEERAKKLRELIESTYRKEYADVLDCEPKGLNAHMPFSCEIEPIEGAKPYNQKLRRLSPLEMNLLSDYIKEMVEGGRIRPSDSQWGANVLFVPKPCGGFRCCQDYRELNKRIRHDTYPLPRIDVHMDMAQGVFWSKMDLLKGFYQLPMHPDSVKFTAFNTLLGKYEFLVMPMGLQCAPGVFMRAMNHVFEGLLWDPNLRQECGVLVYLDDILIFSQTEEQHMQILKQVLDRLRQYHLQCRFDKCSFAVTEVDYLGFRLSHHGVRMDPKKVEIVKNWSEEPKCKGDVRAFLGLVNYLKRFCKGLSNFTAPLSDWAAEKCKDPWTEKHKECMRIIKDMLCSDEVLACPKIDPETGNYYPFTVITDASELAVGAILLQQQGPSKSDTKVIGYASSKFKSAEKHYSVHEKELLGVLLAVQQWNCFLEGSKFTVYTDHSSLVWLNKQKDLSRRQSRWVDILQGHDFEVIYMKGETNPADAFTRVPWQYDTDVEPERPPPFSVVDEHGKPIDDSLVVIRSMRTALADAGLHVKVSPSKLHEWQVITDQLLQQPWKQPPLYRTIASGYASDPCFQDIHWINKHSLSFKDGLYFKGSLVVVPNVFEVKRDVLIEHHDSLVGGHLGLHKTVEKITRLFWWPGMVSDIEGHVKTCPACQVSKYRNWKPQGTTFDLKPATEPWEVVHVDFAGPFKYVSPGGYNRIAIFTDSFTKLAVFVRCRTTMNAEQLADLYLEHVWKVYGRPGKLVSDNEPTLCHEAWVKMHEKLGTKVSHIAAYNAKANGAAEVMVKQLKSMLRAYEVQGLRWWKVLAACERGYNDSVHSATGFTPFYMNFGRHPYRNMGTVLEPLEQGFVEEFVHATQAELARVHDLARERIQAKLIKDTAKRNASRSPTLEYQVGDYVYLETSAIKKSHALAPLRSGPHKVVEVTANGNAVRLEGFKHPFNVEIITPALCFPGGVNTHLVQYDLETASVAPLERNARGVATVNNEIDTHEPVEHVDLLSDSDDEGDDETWEVTPLVRMAPNAVLGVPGMGMGHSDDVGNSTETEGMVSGHTVHDGDTSDHVGPVAGGNVGLCDANASSQDGRSGGSLATHDTHVESAEIWDVPLHTILAAELPAFVRIEERQGRTDNSAMVVCLLENGQRCRLRQKHLKELVGPVEYARLLGNFRNPT